MDFDHSANCEWRLFGRACSCDAPKRAREEQESIARMSESGVMPLASEVAELKKKATEANQKEPRPEGFASKVAANMAPIIEEAVDKLTAQGLTQSEAMAVIERRIRG